LTRGPQVRIYGKWIQEEIFTFNPIILEIADRTGSHIRNRVTGRNSVLALFFSVGVYNLYNYYERHEVTFNSARKVEFLWKSTNLPSLS
jgi:hypothetical protein